MTIRAVVLDIGGVLEIIDDSVFPGPWRRRHEISQERYAVVPGLPGDGMVGEPAADWQPREWSASICC